MTHDFKNNMLFTASLLFKSEHEPPSNGEPLLEEKIVLLEAVDKTAAQNKAAQYGKAEEHQYRNEKGELVSWSFKCVERLCQVDDTILKDESELFSRFLRDSEVKSLLTPFDN